MKLKQSMRYHLREFYRASMVYYIVIAVLIVLMFILKAALRSNSVNMTGMDSSTVIFLFVLGLNAFKSPFGLFLQSGISRRTLWVDVVLSSVIVAVSLAVVDNLLPFLFRDSLNYSTSFMNTYQGGGRFTFSFLGLSWTALINLFAMMFGFFLTTLFYRMNKPLKVLVSVGVPLVFFVLMPMAEVFIPSFNFLTWLLDAYTWCMGISFFGIYGEVAPMRALATLGIGSVVMMGLSYLLVFRAKLKEA